MIQRQPHRWKYIYTVQVWDLFLPDSFTVKLEYLPIQNVLNLPASATAIEDEAFAGLTNVDAVRIPDSVIAIADNAFDGSQVKVITPTDSFAEYWAISHGYIYINE